MSWLERYPWTAGDLRVTRAALEEVERLARIGYAADEEVCGVLTGPAAEPLLCDRALPIENIARSLHERDPKAFFRTARTFFAFYARTLERIMADGASADAPVKVLYHSHLDAPAELSGTDAAVLSGGIAPSHAGGPATLGAGPPWPLAFLVSGVIRRDGGAPRVDDHRLYVWKARGFEPSKLEIV